MFFNMGKQNIEKRLICVSNTILFEFLTECF